MANNTETEILLAVNSVLQEYEAEVIGNPSKNLTRIRVISRDRVKAKTDVEEALTKENIDWQNATQHTKYRNGWPPSSFSGTVVESSMGSLTEFVYKNKGAGGSGAGAELTKLSESAQCVFAAVRAVTGKSDSGTVFDIKNIRAASRKFDIPGDVAKNDCEKIRKELTEDWITSCDRGAAELLTKVGSNYVFHRGSKTVDRIEDAFKRVKKKEGIRMDINKWSPADIYCIAPAFDATCLGEEESIKGLNQCMQERIQKKIAMGVSLKKITASAHLKEINFDRKQKNEHKFARFEMGKTSLDGYIHFNTGVKIQFRTFGGQNLTGWQGEVKGASANQGKISLGPINLLIKNHIGGAFQVPTGAARMVTSGSDVLLADIERGLKTYAKASKGEIDKILGDPTKATNPFLYSKWQCIKLFDIISGIKPKAKKDQLCEDFLLYASSKSSISAPYYKLE
jgi:hypothetical protein